MRRTHQLLLALSYAACVAGPARAADARPAAVGTLVRVTAPSVFKKRVTGTLVSASDQELVLALPDSGRKAIPRGAVTRLEWSRGFHRHPIPGALIGGVLGGAFFAYASYALCEAESCSGSMQATLAGVALGALPGAGIGALIKTRDWTEMEPARLQLTLAPVRGRGVAAQLSLRF